uniref:ARID domain-containing protein n=1 Tax=Rhabditophanes sp. KR3021 TaxID=114890 RepID=A0AC35TSU2_9BILA
MDPQSMLVIGTEVSGKFKGAFCECRIMRVVTEDVRVTLKLNDSAQPVTMNIKKVVSGNLEKGSEVVVETDRGNLPGIIRNIKDCSTYAVQFDDDDKAQLKRAQIKPKGKKHFIGELNMDNMPLTNPDKLKVSADEPHLGRSSSGGRYSSSPSVISTPSRISSPDTTATRSTNRRQREKSADSVASMGVNHMVLSNLRDFSPGSLAIIEFSKDRVKGSMVPYPAIIIPYAVYEHEMKCLKKEVLPLGPNECSIINLSVKKYEIVSKERCKSFEADFVKSLKVTSPFILGAYGKAKQYREEGKLPDIFPAKKFLLSETLSSEYLGSKAKSVVGQKRDETPKSRTTVKMKPSYHTLDESVGTSSLSKGSTNGSTSDESDYDDESSAEYKDAKSDFEIHFFNHIYSVNDNFQGLPLINGTDTLDVYKLHKLVERAGGPSKMKHIGKWESIYEKMGFAEDCTCSLRQMITFYEDVIKKFLKVAKALKWTVYETDFKAKRNTRNVVTEQSKAMLPPIKGRNKRNSTLIDSSVGTPDTTDSFGRMASEEFKVNEGPKSVTGEGSSRGSNSVRETSARPLRVGARRSNREPSQAVNYAENVRINRESSIRPNRTREESAVPKSVDSGSTSISPTKKSAKRNRVNSESYAHNIAPDPPVKRTYKKRASKCEVIALSETVTPVQSTSKIVETSKKSTHGARLDDDINDQYTNPNIFTFFTNGSQMVGSFDDKFYDLKIVESHQLEYTSLVRRIKEACSPDFKLTKHSKKDLAEIMGSFYCDVHYIRWNSRFDEPLGLNRLWLKKSAQDKMEKVYLEYFSQELITEISEWCSSAEGVQSISYSCYSNNSTHNSSLDEAEGIATDNSETTPADKLNAGTIKTNPIIISSTETSPSNLPSTSRISLSDKSEYVKFKDKPRLISEEQESFSKIEIPELDIPQITSPIPQVIPKIQSQIPPKVQSPIQQIPPQIQSPIPQVLPSPRKLLSDSFTKVTSSKPTASKAKLWTSVKVNTPPSKASEPELLRIPQLYKLPNLEYAPVHDRSDVITPVRSRSDVTTSIRAPSPVPTLVHEVSFVAKAVREMSPAIAKTHALPKYKEVSVDVGAEFRGQDSICSPINKTIVEQIAPLVEKIESEVIQISEKVIEQPAVIVNEEPIVDENKEHYMGTPFNVYPEIEDLPSISSTQYSSEFVPSVEQGKSGTSDEVVEEPIGKSSTQSTLIGTPVADDMQIASPLERINLSGNQEHMFTATSVEPESSRHDHSGNRHLRKRKNKATIQLPSEVRKKRMTQQEDRDPLTLDEPEPMLKELFNKHGILTSEEYMINLERDSNSPEIDFSEIPELCHLLGVPDFSLAFDNNGGVDIRELEEVMLYIDRLAVDSLDRAVVKDDWLAKYMLHKDGRNDEEEEDAPGRENEME